MIRGQEPPQPGPTRVVVVRVDVRLTPRRRPASAQVTQQASPAAQRVASEEARGDTQRDAQQCRSAAHRCAEGSWGLRLSRYRSSRPFLGATRSQGRRRRTGDLAKKIVVVRCEMCGGCWGQTSLSATRRYIEGSRDAARAML